MPGANSARRNVAQLVSLPAPLSLPTQRMSGPAVAEHHGHGLQLADDLPGVRPVVVGPPVDPSRFAGAAVEAVAAIGAVEPDLADVAVVGQQLAKLIAVVLDVLRRCRNPAWLRSHGER